MSKIKLSELKKELDLLGRIVDWSDDTPKILHQEISLKEAEEIALKTALLFEERWESYIEEEAKFLLAFEEED